MSVQGRPVGGTPGGSSVDEILFPGQIEASASISVVVELGGCLLNAQTCQKGRRTRRNTGRVEGRVPTGVRGFTARLRERKKTVWSRMSCNTPCTALFAPLG
ncbi:unnamed protein product [Pleuronectes platessa]|uniref:Uncharacterized protein n=1 Tax=Pleuronectes platessa TaxID=8262 RepID=A0A9N7UQ23_PLEPL|nr:unnamed protein product [Pleuronectes platessa]